MGELWIVDRIEGGFAVCESLSRQSKSIPLLLLPPDVREGDCLREERSVFIHDREETARRREAARRLQEKLFRQG